MLPSICYTVIYMVSVGVRVSLVPRPSPAPVFDRYHVIRGTAVVTDSRHGDIFTFISSATEKLKKQDKFQLKDKSYL